MTKTAARPRNGTLPGTVAPTLLLFCAASLLLPVPGGASEIRVEDRVVDTKADGVCIGFVAPGNQRYLDCLNGTVYDVASGLLWLKKVYCPALGVSGSANWADAMEAVGEIADGLDCNGDGVPDLEDGSQAGDWRLPTDGEWEFATRRAQTLGCVAGDTGGPSLTNDPGTACQIFGPSSFQVLTNDLYWSSTAREDMPNLAWARSLDSGDRFWVPKSVSAGSVRIWPVREALASDGLLPVVVDGAPVETAAAGPCHDSLGFGPERYVDCGDGTVLDLVTGLLWLRDATCTYLGSGVRDWIDALDAVAELGDGVCGLADGSQPGDWRLPFPAEWALTSTRAVELGCTSPGPGDPPALTDTAGTGCLAAGDTPFVGIADATSLDFFTTVASDIQPDKTVVWRLLFADSFSLRSKTENSGSWIWPVRPRAPR